MCVILVPTKEHPTAAELAPAESTNPHGAGIAWYKNGEVSYEKAIDAAKVMEIIEKEKPTLPYIIHFRIASVGEVCPKLTHPFPMDKKVALTIKDKTKNPVLFHNGTWSDWKQSIMPFSGEADFPEGPLQEDWSDSRALAYMAYKTKKGFLRFINEKIAIMENTGEVNLYGSWQKHEDIWYSNLNHVRTRKTYYWDDVDDYNMGYGTGYYSNRDKQYKMWSQQNIRDRVKGS